MRNKNLWIILAAVLLVAAVAVLAIVMRPAPAQLSADAPSIHTDAPSAGEPQAYLLVTVGGVTYQPLGLTAEGDFTLTQGDSGMVNVVHVTSTSVRMASSTCDNQDCVEQGEVSLETMDERVLGNMIICLPHQLTLELYTVEEMQALLTSISEEAAE